MRAEYGRAQSIPRAGWCAHLPTDQPFNYFLKYYINMATIERSIEEMIEDTEPTVHISYWNQYIHFV